MQTVRKSVFGLVLAIGLPILSLLGLGAASAHATDLVFASLVRTSPPVVLTDGTVRVNVALRIRNQHAPAAPLFKISAEARGHPTVPTDFFTVPLRAGLPGGGITGTGGDGWYVWTWLPLPGGSTVAGNARVIFPAAWRGRIVSFRLIADSCAGDEFMPPHCRVKETSEVNNRSIVLTLALP